MKREELIYKGFKKVMSRIEKMKASTNVSWLSEPVKINSKLTLKIECVRDEYNYLGEKDGKPYGWIIYAIVNGKEVDSCTDHWSLEKDIRYLLQCYA